MKPEDQHEYHHHNPRPHQPTPPQNQPASGQLSTGPTSIPQRMRFEQHHSQAETDPGNPRQRCVQLGNRRPPLRRMRGDHAGQDQADRPREKKGGPGPHYRGIHAQSAPDVAGKRQHQHPAQANAHRGNEMVLRVHQRIQQFGNAHRPPVVPPGKERHRHRQAPEIKNANQRNHHPQHRPPAEIAGKKIHDAPIVFASRRARECNPRRGPVDDCTGNFARFQHRASSRNWLLRISQACELRASSHLPMTTYY